MRLRAAFLVVGFCALSIPGYADTFDWSYSINCYLCGPFVNQQGMPVDTGGSPATLFNQAGGTMTTTNTAVNGALTITGITGTRTTNWYMGQYLHPPETDTITGLIPPDPTNPSGLTIATDNLLYPNGDPHLDYRGFAYTIACPTCAGGGIVGPIQITGQGPGSYAELGTNGLVGQSSFTLTAVPEPTTFAFLGIAGFALLLYRFPFVRRIRSEINET